MSVVIESTTVMRCDAKRCDTHATSRNNTFDLSAHFEIVGIEWGPGGGEWNGHLCKRHAEEFRALVRSYVTFKEHPR